MKTAQADLTTGPLGKKIFRFSIPLIFSNLLQVLFNMADVAVVGPVRRLHSVGSGGLHHHFRVPVYRLPHRTVRRR